MTPLERKALATPPMSKEAVEFFYDVLCRSETETAARVRKLCLSHERLRMELEGAEVLLADAKRQQDEAVAKALETAREISPELS